LEVRDPLGGTLFWNSPTSESGGTFDGVNVNGACETFTANAPTEAISFAPGAVPTGSYEILVFYNQDCETNGAVPFTIDAVVDGTALPQITGTMLPNQVFAASFEVDAEGAATPRNGGIVQESLPATAADMIAAAQPVTLDAPVTGAVSNDQVFQSYSFDAAAGDVISASIEATSGSLDTFLFLLDSTGAVVAQNDDANDTTRNSQIANQVIGASGTYTLVATRYAQTIGGTEGDFSLTLSGATTEAIADVAVAPAVTDGLPQGIIEIVLNWNTTADLQLLVRDPAGDAVFDTNPTIASGGQLLLTGNVDCSNAAPLSYINWPTGTRIRPGTYEIDVWFQNNCGDTTPVNATLNVGVRNGGNRTNIITEEFTPLLDEHFIVTFTINADGTISTGPGGIAGGSETIDYTGELATAPTLSPNIPVQGNISDDNRFDVYTFDGTANSTVSVRMDATAGTLDTLIFLLGPTGIELASNDDIVPGENRNSLISEFTLPQSGQYVVLATHYGTIFGGTNGVYTLVLSQ
ncbi:MAG: PPC domain-containing protein, partial [Chloroflexota bacterium]